MFHTLIEEDVEGWRIQKEQLWGLHASNAFRSSHFYVVAKQLGKYEDKVQNLNRREKETINKLCAQRKAIVSSNMRTFSHDRQVMNHGYSPENFRRFKKQLKYISMWYSN